MANLDLSKYGITGVTEILHNPSYDVLFAESENVKTDEKRLSDLRAEHPAAVFFRTGYAV